MFDIMKEGMIAFVNVCCFEAEQTQALIAHVQLFNAQLQMGQVSTPVLSNRIDTIRMHPFVLPVEEIQIAGEVELYSYHALYLAGNGDMGKQG